MTITCWKCCSDSELWCNRPALPSNLPLHCSPRCERLPLAKGEGETSYRTFLEQSIQLVDEPVKLAERGVDRGGLPHVDARVAQQV